MLNLTIEDSWIHASIKGSQKARDCLTCGDILRGIHNLNLSIAMLQAALSCIVVKYETDLKGGDNAEEKE